MNAKNRILAVLVLSLAVCSSYAQGGGGRQGRGRFGNPYGVSTLLGRADVQKDLGLSSDQVTKIEDARQAARGAGGGNRGAGGGGFGGGGGANGGPPDQAAMDARQAERDKPYLDILTDDQKARIHQIQIQLEGDLAAIHPDVQTALGLSSDQISQIKDLQAKEAEANRAVMEKVRNQELDRQAAGQARQTNAQAVKDGIHKILTEAQQAKLKEMGGKPFVADTSGGR